MTQVLRIAFVLTILLSGCIAFPDPGSIVVAPPPSSDWTMPSHDLLGSRAAPDAGLGLADIPSMGLSWRYDTDGAVTGTPTVADGRVLFGTWSGSVYAVALESGDLLWHRDHGAQVDSTITQWQGIAYVSDAAGTLTALSAETGDIVWAVTVDDTTSAHLYSSPVIWESDAPILVVGVASDQESIAIHGDQPLDFRGKVVAYDARTGTELWRTVLVPEGQTGAPVWGGLAIAEDTVFFGTGNAYTEPAGAHTDAIVALDVRTGAMRWHYQTIDYDVFTQANPINPDHDFGSTPSIFPAGDRLLVGIGQKSSIYWAADAATGEIVWSHGESQGGEGIIGDSAYWDGVVVVNHATKKTTTAIDAVTGQTLWLHDAGANLFSDPAIVPGAVFTGDGNGNAKALSLHDGSVLWEAETGAGAVFGGLSVASRTLLVPTVGDGFLSGTGAVLAFRPGGTGAASSSSADVPPDTMLLKDFKFVPERLEVKAGTTVRFGNLDAAFHTATSGWDNGTTFDLAIDGGDSATWTFDGPGTYVVYCRPHAAYNGGWTGMVGTVVVS